MDRGEQEGAQRPGGVAAAWGGPELGPRVQRGLRALGRRSVGSGGAVAVDGGAALGHTAAGLVSGRARGGALHVALCGSARDGQRQREQLMARGAVLRGDDDAELLLHLVASSRQTALGSRVVDALYQFIGAFAVVVMGEGRLIGARDPLGFWPMWLGRRGVRWGLASEPAALIAMELEPLRELGAGELLVIGAEGVSSARAWPEATPRPCAVDRALWSRPDSPGVHGARRALGQRLAAEQPAAVDVVVALSRDDEAAASGFAEALGRPRVSALLDEDGLLTAVPALVAGARVALIGGAPRAAGAAVSALQRAGAGAVELRWTVPGPPAACPYQPSGGARGGEPARGPAPGALSAAGLVAALGGDGGACAGCLDGRWPLAWAAEPERVQLALFGGPAPT